MRRLRRLKLESKLLPKEEDEGGAPKPDAVVATTEGTLLTPLLANDPIGAASNPLLLGTVVAAVAEVVQMPQMSSLNIGLPLVIVDVVATSVFCFVLCSSSSLLLFSFAAYPASQNQERLLISAPIP